MKKLTKEELKIALDLHKEWLMDNQKGERANLSSANLSSANLSYADLSYANLSYADLSFANLSFAIGNNKNVISAQSNNYNIVYTSDYMWIGCRKHPLKTWWKDSEKESENFSKSDLEWRKNNKRWINAMIKANPAQPTGYKE